MNASSNSVQHEEFEMLRELVKSMSAELAVLSQTIHQQQHGRQLWHNNSFLSIYEFPQYQGYPIYTPGFTQVKDGTYAVNERYVLPGSGEFDKFGKQRPKYYMPALYAPTDATTGTTYLGKVYNSGDTAWMLFATALVFTSSSSPTFIIPHPHPHIYVLTFDDTGVINVLTWIGHAVQWNGQTKIRLDVCSACPYHRLLDHRMVDDLRLQSRLCPCLSEQSRQRSVRQRRTTLATWHDSTHISCHGAHHP